MAKFFIGLVTGVVLVFLSFILLFFAALRLREKPPVLACARSAILGGICSEVRVLHAHEAGRADRRRERRARKGPRRGAGPRRHP